MSSSIHPDLKLNIVLDEESYVGDADAEIARRFSAVAPTEVKRAAKGSQRVNVLLFDVGMNAVDEQEDDPLWRGALTTWLDEEFAETSALVARENDARRNNGERTLPFAWAEVRFGAGPAIAVRMVDSAIPAAAAGFVERARTLLSEGALGADPIEVIRIPACASIEAQRDDAQAGRAAGRQGAEGSTTSMREALRAIGKEERGSSSASDIIAAVTEAAGLDEGAGQGGTSADPDADASAWATGSMERDEPTAAEIDEALAQAEAALRHGDDPTDAAAEERDEQAELASPPDDIRASVDGGAEAGGASDGGATAGDAAPSAAGADGADADEDTSGEGCALVGEDVPGTLDYRIWNVAYADGTSVRFDSVLGEAILD